MPTAGVDFFRVDRSGPTKRLLFVAVAMVLGGSSSIGAHLVTRLPQTIAHVISLAGGIVLLAGLLLGFGTMAMLLFENVYLVIQDKGVLLHDNGKETTIAWPDLDAVEVDAGYVVFRRKEADAIRWFAGKGAAQVQGRVDEARRKALHGLLKLSS